jgi:hypothetical protein
MSDTIRIGEIPEKHAEDVIYETTIDTIPTIVINELLARNSSINTDMAGDYDDWFELYNYGDLPVKIDDFWFSDDPLKPLKWKMSSDIPIYLDPGGYYLIWADEEPDEGSNHASFKLSGSGEYLAISNADSVLIDEVYYEEQSSNISYGRYPDGGQSWQFCTTPSPGKQNNSSGGESILPPPKASHIGGLFQDPFILKLNSEIPDCEIRYTLDCTEPDYTSTLYDDSIRISKTTIVRARLIKEGHVDGMSLSISFLFEENHYKNPIISLVSTPNNFFGDGGLISSNSKSIEIPANFEFIENGKAVYTGGAGIQNHSVKNAKPNSMRLYARSRYGDDWFKHPFFEDQAPSLHKRLILRNAGNDNINRKVTNSHMRDPMASAIAEASNENALTSASRPVNVFVNGEFHGLFNLRERIDEYYIETHTSDSQNFDLLERSFGYGKNRNVLAGSYDAWDELIKFVDTIGNLADNADYQYVKSQVDIKNFTDYWITEVFLGNYDWLSNNIKFWKSENGKWQWIYWDMDHSIGLIFNSFGDVDWNTLNWSLSFSDRAWPNGFNNILMRSLLLNKTYEEFFIKRFTHLLNTSFSYKETRNIAESMQKAYQNDLSLHAVKWERDMKDWNEAYEIIDNYLTHRPDEQMKHLRSFFNLEKPINVTLNCMPPGAGTLSMGEYIVSSESHSGNYFPNMVYELNPTPIAGFILHDIIVNGESTDSSSIYLSKDTEITAVFIPVNSPATLTITELYFNNRETYDSGDWIELCNYGLETLDISGAQIVGPDEDILYTFEAGTLIGPEQYFVVTENRNEFLAIYPESILSFGDLKTDINDSSIISLQLMEEEVYAEIHINDTDGWPLLAHEGYSYELNDLINDPVVGENWTISKNPYGSPGILNQLHYIFHRPLGKDTVFFKQESTIVPFMTSDDFYFDWDNHELAAIYVNSVEGPGKISTDLKIVESNVEYDADDFVYEPGDQNLEPTIFTYYFIDRSGQRSKNHSIEFSNLTNLTSAKVQALKQYPIPARDEFFIELPEISAQFLEFFIFDISGNVVKKITLNQAPVKLRVDVQSLSSGMYFFHLKLDGDSYYGKIEVVK